MTFDDATQERKAHLTVNASDLSDAVRPIVRASRRSAANEATFSFANGDLVIEVAGVAATVPATGVWPGVATVPKSALGMLANVSGRVLEIRITAENRLHIGGMSFDARWHEGTLTPTDLPIDPPLNDVLRLRQAHSDEALLAHGLLERVALAEAEAARSIENAVDQLKPLGDFRAAIFKLVREAFPQADLPAGHSLLQALRLRRDHSDAELRTLGLLDRATTAEADRDRRIDSAVHSLKPLGDFRTAIGMLVRDELNRH